METRERFKGAKVQALRNEQDVYADFISCILQLTFRAY